MHTIRKAIKLPNGKVVIREVRTIYFYSRDRDKFGWLSSMYGGFTILSEYWPSPENYYQAMKTLNFEERERIRQANPYEAKRLGRKVKQFRPGWKYVKENVMFYAHMAKYQQNLDLRRRLLLETGDAHLVEDSPHDYYWGIGKDGTGENRLGVILMRIRRYLRQSKVILVTGDQNWTNVEVIAKKLAEQPKYSTVIHGATKGVDTIAGNVAFCMGFGVIAVPAQSEVHGKAAELIRNQQMLDMGPDIILAFHDDIRRSKGTKDLITRARRAGVEVHLYDSEGNEYDW